MPALKPFCPCRGSLALLLQAPLGSHGSYMDPNKTGPGCQTYGDARSLAPGTSWTCRTAGHWGCHTPEATRPFGKPDPGAIKHLELLDPWTFGLLRAARLPGQTDSGVFGHPGLLDPWSYWNHRSDRSQGCCASGTAESQIQPEPGTARPLGQSKPGALGHPQLSNPWSCWIPGQPDPGGHQTAGDSLGSGASKPP